MNFSAENIDVTFWLSFGEVKLPIDINRTLVAIPLLQTLLKSFGKIHFKQYLILKRVSIFSSVKEPVNQREGNSTMIFFTFSSQIQQKDGLNSHRRR
jgi:hypothetical protein